MTDANNTSSSPAFPVPLSHLQHLLIFGLESWTEPQNKAERGRDRTQDGDEERLARTRQREREKAMVFLDVLVNYGCRRWLHKEDYTFE